MAGLRMTEARQKDLLDQLNSKEQDVLTELNTRLRELGIEGFVIDGLRMTPAPRLAQEMEASKAESLITEGLKKDVVESENSEMAQPSGALKAVEKKGKCVRWEYYVDGNIFRKRCVEYE